MTQAGPKKLLKIAQSCSKLFKTCSFFFKIDQNASKCRKMGQQVSKGVMCLHMQV
jgi:hypothetical protein